MVARQAHNLEVSGSIPLSATFFLSFCENSSVGRARPCQGRGRGFESRFSLIGPNGGIGRRVGLKHQWRNPSRFDPGFGYTQDDSPESDFAEVVKLVDTLL